MDCGGKRSAAPLWECAVLASLAPKAPSSLRFAGALHILPPQMKLKGLSGALL